MIRYENYPIKLLLIKIIGVPSITIYQGIL